MGRNPILDKSTQNLLANLDNEKPCVASDGEEVFRLVNRNIRPVDRDSWLGVGHLNTRGNLLMILHGI
jgi:hypothetical protein